MSVSRIETGGVGQAGSVWGTMTGQPEEQPMLQTGAIKKVKEADVAAGYHWFLSRLEQRNPSIMVRTTRVYVPAYPLYHTDPSKSSQIPW
jgi:hypothetical protein